MTKSNNTGTAARSRPKRGVGYFGPYPEALREVLEQASRQGFAVASNFSREFSTEVALAASLGWISTVSHDGRSCGRTWNVTLEGQSALRSIL